MRKREQPKFGDLEMHIMNLLWDRGPSTVREVAGALSLDPPPAYTTVLTMLRVMQEKGFVDRDESGKAHVYQACVPERQVKRNLLRDVVRTAFRGSPEALLLRLLEDEKLSADELARIQALIERKSRKE
jgi:predicted transcriptional regulator